MGLLIFHQAQSRGKSTADGVGPKPNDNPNLRRPYFINTINHRH